MIVYSPLTRNNVAATLNPWLCSPEISELADHGTTLPPNMQGLTDEQLVDLKLKDEWEERCVPSGGAVFKNDEIGRRNGHGGNQTKA